MCAQLLLTSGVILRAATEGFGTNPASNPEPAGQLQRPVAASQSPAALFIPHMLALQLPAVMFSVTVAVLLTPCCAA